MNTTGTPFTRLGGLVALVTGAGGGKIGGIGAGVARCMARAGARIAINDLTEESANATVAQLKALGAEALSVVGDVADPVQAAGLVERTVEHFGQIDILVNNAGITGTQSGVAALTDEEWQKVLAVNLHGPFFTSRAAVQAMRPRGFGRIINIAGLAAIRMSILSGSPYTATKEALLGLTRHMSIEVAQHGISVNAILPGYTVTPLIQSMTTEETRANIAAGVPAQRGADPEEIAALVAFLASPAAGYINGAAIPVDGALSVLPGDYTQYRKNSGKYAAKAAGKE